jgi:ATP-binding cassette subfamily B (MDR/TAP) protein 1
MAGGEHTLNTCGEGTPTSYVQIGGAGKSFPVTSEAVIESDPDLVIVCPCGLDLEMSKRETDRLMTQEWFADLRAIKNKRLLVVDGDAMFNRPGPRLVDALEWLVSVLHTGDIPSVRHAVSLQPKDFPFIDYFKTVSESDSEVNTADIKKSEEMILAAIEVAHQAAVDIGSLTYEDPETGYQVFSVLAAHKRGKCCGNRCRHCPFGHYNVKEEDRLSSAVNRITKPTLLRAVGKLRQKRGTMNDDINSQVIQKEATGEETMVDVMFWSGGKDSYLSLLLLEQLHIKNNSERKIVLLTTFEGSSSDGEIAHQGLYCKDIMNQAKILGLDLCLVPIEIGASNLSYKDIVSNALDVLKKELESDLRVSAITFRLVFGDLHLQDIKDWRVSTFPDNECIFPAFGMDYAILQNVLFNAVNRGDSIKSLRAEVESISISAWSGNFADETTTSLFSKGNIPFQTAVNFFNDESNSNQQI